jgi:hypothetical protein
MATEKDSSLRFQSGTHQPVSCTILHNEDPLQMGRLFCYPDHWDPSKVPLENGLWVHNESPEPQTQGLGSTRHAHHHPGTRGHMQYDADGTPHFRRAATTQTGGDAPAGSASAPEGDNTYPGPEVENA